MKTKLCLFTAIFLGAIHVRAQGTAFTYQGRLHDGATPANGSYDLRFSIWDDGTNGTRLGDIFTNSATAVSNGLFLVALDFGAVFDGTGRWLEIGVRSNGIGGFTTLSPRQKLTATPYAIYAAGVAAAGINGPIPAGNIANGTITSNMLAAGAAAANLTASGQSAVPGEAMVLSSNPNATNLTAAGYTRFGGQVDLSWQLNANSQSPDPRGSHRLVWTGNKMIVWGGTGKNLNQLNTGGVYDPANNSWSPTAANGAPSVPGLPSAVWTGSEMIVWGGQNAVGDELGTGARYNLASNTWTSMTTSGAPFARSGHTAVWTGSEMIVWGGSGSSGYLNTGGRYNPATDSWTPISTNGAPSPPMLVTAVWTGSEMIIWGGFSGVNQLANGGARYNPNTDSWSPITTTDAPALRYEHSSVWTGSEMIVWGGRGTNWVSGVSNDGARYNPTNDTWSAITTIGSPSARAAHTAVWSGKEMIVWGGVNNVSPYWVNTGGRYDPANDSWSAVTTSGAPAPRQGHSAVWTGTEMIIFGGYNNDTFFGDTYSYAPSRVMYLYLRP